MPYNIEIHQWHINIRAPQNAFQLWFVRNLLGWETYYGVTPPWQHGSKKDEA